MVIRKVVLLLVFLQVDIHQVHLLVDIHRARCQVHIQQTIFQVVMVRLDYLLPNLVIHLPS
jgi:hypothetical protein